MKATDKTGNLVSIKEVVDNDDLICVTKDGLVIRQHVKELRVMGRNTQGVRVIRLSEGDRVAAVANVPSDEDKEIDDAASETGKPKPSGPPAPDQATIFEGE
jgi:DNA gyrase subunit A